MFNLLDPGDRFSIYAYVDSDELSLCIWSLDNNFQLNATNHFQLNLEKSMTEKTISFNTNFTMVNTSG
ncbi:MAG: hypothetical protein R2764_03360 [Bacteroidales bacterium]